MQLEHSFTVPAEVDEAWQVLLDIERVAPCMPGATLETVEGDDFTGTVKVRLGPIGLTYKGKARFVEKDAESHRVVLDAQGKDARGNGTASATVTATLTPDPAGSAVTVVTDLSITGKPAQFGRGVMLDVGNKLIGQFADCLAGKLSAGQQATSPVGEQPSSTAGEHAAPASGEAQQPVSANPAAAGSTPATAPQSAASSTSEPAPIDLLGAAGPALAKRFVPVLLGLVLLLIVLGRRRRR